MVKKIIHLVTGVGALVFLLAVVLVIKSFCKDAEVGMAGRDSTPKEIIDDPRTQILPLLRQMASEGTLRIGRIKLLSPARNSGEQDLPPYYYTAIFDPMKPISGQKPLVLFEDEKTPVGWDRRRPHAAEKAAQAVIT